MLEILRTVEELIIKSTDEEIHFIFGGALGVDQMAFHICDILRQKSDYINREITLEVAVPFKDQPNAWFKNDDKERYNKQLEIADKVTYVDGLDEYRKSNTKIGEYNVAKMQLRNMYMVDNSDVVIAVWDGTSGGTGNCVKYARKIEREIIQINPKECE